MQCSLFSDCDVSSVVYPGHAKALQIHMEIESQFHASQVQVLPDSVLQAPPDEKMLEEQTNPTQPTKKRKAKKDKSKDKKTSILRDEGRRKKQKRSDPSEI